MMIDVQKLKGTLQKTASGLIAIIEDHLEPKKAYFYHLLLLKITKKLEKNEPEFYQNLAKYFLRHALRLLCEFKNDADNMHDAFKIAHFISLSKNFRDLAKSLKPFKVPQTFKDLEILFDETRIKPKEHVLELKGKENTSLREVINNITFAIYRFTEFPKEEAKEKYPEIFENLEMLSFAEELTKGDITSMNYINMVAATIFRLRHKNNSIESIIEVKLKTLPFLEKLDFSQKVTKLDLPEGIKHWYVSNESRRYRAALFPSPECKKSELLRSQKYNDGNKGKMTNMGCSPFKIPLGNNSIYIKPTVVTHNYLLKENLQNNHLKILEDLDFKKGQAIYNSTK